MAIAQGYSAAWSDIESLYSTLRSIQSTHGLSQTGSPAAAGYTIYPSHISTLYSAAASAHGETHLKSKGWSDVGMPNSGSLIYPGVVSTISSNISNMNGVCHYSPCFSFEEFYCTWYSARNKKENIHFYTDNATDLINNIKIVDFNYKDDKEKNYKVGFIADDTHEIFSSKNHNIMDGYNCIGMLLKSVQELDTRLKELENV